MINGTCPAACAECPFLLNQETAMNKVLGLLVSLLAWAALPSCAWAQERAIDKEVVITARLEQA